MSHKIKIKPVPDGYRCDRFSWQLHHQLRFLQILNEIEKNKIRIYEFPDVEDEDENKHLRKLKVCFCNLNYSEECLSSSES